MRPAVVVLCAVLSALLAAGRTPRDRCATFIDTCDPDTPPAVVAEHCPPALLRPLIQDLPRDAVAVLRRESSRACWDLARACWPSSIRIILGRGAPVEPTQETHDASQAAAAKNKALRQAQVMVDTARRRNPVVLGVSYRDRLRCAVWLLEALSFFAACCEDNWWALSAAVAALVTVRCVRWLACDGGVVPVHRLVRRLTLDPVTRLAAHAYLDAVSPYATAVLLPKRLRVLGSALVVLSAVVSALALQASAENMFGGVIRALLSFIPGAAITTRAAVAAIVLVKLSIPTLMLGMACRSWCTTPHLHKSLDRAVQHVIVQND